MESEEQRWIREYLEGQVDSLGKLVERTKRPLYAYICKMVGDRFDADEIFQEVWIRASRSLAQYRDKSLMGWLCRIAHNLMIDRFRSQQSAVSLDAPYADDGPALSDQLADPAPDPAEAAGAMDLRARILEAVARLPPEQREVFLLRSEASLPFKEIARIQGVSINTALARMQYAIRKLRYDLKDLDV
ncbi:MAG: sigma-70 family RNA polymerase sigma factor [Kiritimatiellae bacterium]|nr:sigma-70 family RNA polymerase sigma factor [Kiritimatiellia bacterium]MDW8458713.1 sigma-70 family RNA polymerase sigma factor [Verrucomicrobiota bacterium]